MPSHVSISSSVGYWVGPAGDCEAGIGSSRVGRGTAAYRISAFDRFWVGVARGLRGWIIPLWSARPESAVRRERRRDRCGLVVLGADARWTRVPVADIARSRSEELLYRSAARPMVTREVKAAICQRIHRPPEMCAGGCESASAPFWSIATPSDAYPLIGCQYVFLDPIRAVVICENAT